MYMYSYVWDIFKGMYIYILHIFKCISTLYSYILDIFKFICTATYWKYLNVHICTATYWIYLNVYVQLHIGNI